jgi:hypothetical protein
MLFKFKASEVEGACSKIRRYLKEGAAYILEIKEAKNKRSLQQNKYYWGVVVEIVAEHTGYNPHEAHQELAEMFLSYTHENGKRFVESTTELNTLEFEKYTEKCRIWAASELQVTIPLPNEITEESWMQIQNMNQ